MRKPKLKPLSCIVPVLWESYLCVQHTHREAELRCRSRQDPSWLCSPFFGYYCNRGGKQGLDTASITLRFLFSFSPPFSGLSCLSPLPLPKTHLACCFLTVCLKELQNTPQAGHHVADIHGGGIWGVWSLFVPNFSNFCHIWRPL